MSLSLMDRTQNYQFIIDSWESIRARIPSICSDLAWHISILANTLTYDVTCHFTRHLARGIDAFLLDLSLSRCFRAVDSLPWKRLAESEKTILRESLQCLPFPCSSSPSPSHAFYFMALSVNCRRIGNSTGSPACCAPPGDELLLSRASRSRGLTLCGLSSWGSGLEKPK